MYKEGGEGGGGELGGYKYRSFRQTLNLLKRNRH